MRSDQPSFEFLVTSSETSLESFELARLNAIANLRKELRQIVDEWIEAEVQARIARWILERRRPESEPSSALSPSPAQSETISPSTLPPDARPKLQQVGEAPGSRPDTAAAALKSLELAVRRSADRNSLPALVPMIACRREEGACRMLSPIPLQDAKPHPAFQKYPPFRQRVAAAS